MNKIFRILLSILIASCWCCLSPAAAVLSFATAKEFTMGSCRFRLHLRADDDFKVFPRSGGPAAGRYRPSNRSGDFEAGDGFKIICLDASDPETVAKWVGTKRVDGRWLRYDSMGGYPRSLMPFAKGQHARILALAAKNSTGIGLTVDDITGDEAERGRNFSGCVVHANQALCLSAYTMFLKNRKIDLLPAVLSVFQRIEFVDAKSGSGHDTRPLPGGKWPDGKY